MNFTMNLSQNLMTILAIFFEIKETISGESWIFNEHYFYAALPLLQKSNSDLELALPFLYQEKSAAYVWNDNAETFKMACPAAQYEEWATIETNLKTAGKFHANNQLHVMQDYSPDVGSSCSINMVPTINPLKKRCGNFNAKLFDIGYWVLKKNEDTADVQFMSTYQVCYSMNDDKGTQYTIHRIALPKSLLRELWEYYEPDLERSFQSFLQKKEKTVEMFSLLYEQNENYPYQLVSFQDMPINPWELTTLFHFNYAPVIKKRDVLMGMIIADNYIRLYSKKKNMPLTLYSGVYEVFQDLTSFWRIIMNDAGDALIIVTQKSDKYYLCNENRLIVKVYSEGELTYTCSVDKGVLEVLGLPQLEISGTLGDLLLRKITPSKAPQSSTQTKFVKIIDFMQEDSFWNGLKKFDATLALGMKIPIPIYAPWIYRGAMV